MDNKITVHTITKPVQLISAWFIGLIIIDFIFLLAAYLPSDTGWTKYILVIAAVANVPVFLTCLFLLRVKFRSEFQGGVFYKYVDKKTGKVVKVAGSDLYDARIAEMQEQIELLAARNVVTGTDWSRWRVALNDNLDSFAQIRNALSEAKIPLSSIFGKVNGTNPPQKKIVTFNNKMSTEHITAILKILLPFRLDGFKIEDMSHEIKEDDCIIGAYGCESGYATMTDELKDMLGRSIEKADLEYYARNHWVKK